MRYVSEDSGVTQQIIQDFPPNYHEIDAAFNVRDNHGVIFSFGDRIYAPHGPKIIAPELIAHEGIHGQRQGTKHAKILAWWDRYIDDIEFRLDEELVAHRAEYRHLMQFGNRTKRRAALKRTSLRLSAPLYGEVINRKQAELLLQEGLI